MRLALAAVTASLVVTGCGVLFVEDPAEAASSVASQFTDRGIAWSVSPWPYAESVAWLCVDDPGSLDVGMPPPDTAGCTRLTTHRKGEVLTVEFDVAAAGPVVADRFETTDPPWHMALAGRQGLSSYSTVLPLIDSPVPSDAGPS